MDELGSLRSPCRIGSYYQKLYAEFLFNSMTSVRNNVASPLRRQFSLRERGERRRIDDHLVSPLSYPASLMPQPPPQLQQDEQRLLQPAQLHSPSNHPHSHSLSRCHVRRPSSACSSNGGDSGLGSGPGRGLQQYRSRHDYLYAMTEDLADWLNFLYDREITVESFFDELDTGVLLCNHACQLQLAAVEYFASGHETASGTTGSRQRGRQQIRLPKSAPRFRRDAQVGSFTARDNIAQFIGWCRQLGLPDCLLFETEDLVARKNTRHVILCLLEVARAGAILGVEVPELVRFEREIDEQELSSSSSSSSCDSGLASPATAIAPTPPAPRTAVVAAAPQQQPPVKKQQQQQLLPAFKRRKERWQCDLKSLDELVRELISECTCQQTFPMKRLDEGKYLFGDSQMLIFVRVLRNHVMVRVGGGWDSLEHLLVKHDPCRASGGASRSGVPVNHQEERLKRQQHQQQVLQEQSNKAATELEQQLQQQVLQEQSNKAATELEQQHPALPELTEPPAAAVKQQSSQDDELFVRPLAPAPMSKKAQQQQHPQKRPQTPAASVTRFSPSPHRRASLQPPLKSPQRPAGQQPQQQHHQQVTAVSSSSNSRPSTPSSTPTAARKRYAQPAGGNKAA